MSKSSNSDGHANGACPAPPGSGRRLSHSGTVQESFRGGVLLIAVLMLAGLTAVPPAAQAQQQDTLDRARQQRMEQRRQQREAERRERMKERQKEIQARIQRNAAAPAGAVNEQDSLALVALYDSTDGDNWDNNDGWLEAPVSEWHGVTVSGDRVVSLYLAGLCIPRRASRHRPYFHFFYRMGSDLRFAAALRYRCVRASFGALLQPGLRCLQVTSGLRQRGGSTRRKYGQRPFNPAFQT